jgi:hypothetical protein
MPAPAAAAEGNDLEKLFQRDYFEKFNTIQAQAVDTLSQSTSAHNMQTTPRQGKGQMISKATTKPPLSIEIEDDANENRKGKSLIYKPEIKGSAPIQNYSNQTKAGGKTAKSPIAL